MFGDSGQFPDVGGVVPEVPGYRIERQLGRGSMGVVYLAEDLQLRRKVALKVLTPDLADDELFRKRFDRESQSAANLDHPNIVPVYAAGEAGGLLYIAMRYVGGGDLRELIETIGPLSLEQTASIAAAVADALDAAHAQGMIHRDVKPANILTDRRGSQEHYYLSDFGITKMISSGQSLTSKGQIVGTIDYIAPEQVQGKPLDGRADLYALGCVLYQCLTGVVPFPRDETAALMWAQVHDEASPVTTRRPGLPPQIDHIVAKAMAKQPEDRYGTCRELAVALRVLAADPEAASEGGKADSPPPPVPTEDTTGTYISSARSPARVPLTAKSPRRTWWWAAASVLVLALIGGSATGVMKYLSSRFPNEAEQALLLGQVPGSLTMKKSCSRNGEAERDPTNVEASVICSSDGDGVNTVAFTRFTSPKALDSHYQASVATTEIGQGSGDCRNADRAEDAFVSKSGQTSGRVLCYQELGSSFVTWTDDDAQTLGIASRVDPDYMKLRDWWAGVVGLPTSAQTEAEARAQRELEEANRKAEERRLADAKKLEEANAENKRIQEAAEADKRKAEEAANAERQRAEQQRLAAATKLEEANAEKKRAEEAAELDRRRAEAEKAEEDARKRIEEAEKAAQQRTQDNKGSKENTSSKENDSKGSKENKDNSSRVHDLDNPEQNLGNGTSSLDSQTLKPHQESQDPANETSNQNNGDLVPSNQNQGPNNGLVDPGGQGTQQLIDDAIKKATKQGTHRNQDLQKLIEDEIKRANQRQGNMGGQDIQQLIDNALKQALEQAKKSQSNGHDMPTPSR